MMMENEREKGPLLLWTIINTHTVSLFVSVDQIQNKKLHWVHEMPSYSLRLLTDCDKRQPKAEKEGRRWGGEGQMDRG